MMDIDEQDLEQLFQMIDRDQSGTIEVAEFIGPLSRWGGGAEGRGGPQMFRV